LLEQFDLASFHLPADLPVSLPSKLVAQRPDVRAAEAQMHAASARVGVAIANRLPQFTITAAYGGVSTAYSQMFANGNPFWSVIGNAAQTLFAGGTLLHQQRAAEAAFEQAAAQYRGTVITGFQNVADALYGAAVQIQPHALAEMLDASDIVRWITLFIHRRFDFPIPPSAVVLLGCEHH